MGQELIELLKLQWRAMDELNKKIEVLSKSLTGQPRWELDAIEKEFKSNMDEFRDRAQALE